MTNLKKTIRRKEICLKLDLPFYTLTEEILNSLTHGLGVVLSILALIFFIVKYDGNNTKLVCNIIYSSTMLVLYLVSTVYHGLKLNRSKKVFRILDHCSIFLLIAGTYTPISIVNIGGIFGISMVSIIWSVAIVGIVLNAINMKKYTKFSMVCYISMGWISLIAMKYLLKCFSIYQLLMLISGGIVYTIGALIYSKGKKVKYMHSVWHLFVLMGSILHFMLIISF